MAVATAIFLSRLCDALDGAVARQGQPTDAGGFLDITLDFLFYASIPLAFAVADPGANALAAAVLLALDVPHHPNLEALQAQRQNLDAWYAQPPWGLRAGFLCSTCGSLPCPFPAPWCCPWPGVRCWA